MKQCPVCNNRALRLCSRGATVMHRCENNDCRHVFCYPQPDAAALAGYYNADYYCRQSPLYSQTDLIIYKQILAWLPEINGPFLDVGCGNGGFFDALAPESKKFYTGVEADISAGKTAQKKTGCPIVEDLTSLVQGETVYKTIVLNQVIEHLRDPVEVLGQIKQISAADAVIFIATANIDCLQARIKKENWKQLQNRTHLHLFSKQSLSLALAKSGWQNIKSIIKPINYPHHGMIRKKVQQLLRRTGLDGNLTLVAGG